MSVRVVRLASIGFQVDRLRRRPASQIGALTATGPLRAELRELISLPVRRDGGRIMRRPAGPSRRRTATNHLATALANGFRVSDFSPADGARALEISLRPSARNKHAAAPPRPLPSLRLASDRNLALHAARGTPHTASKTHATKSDAATRLCVCLRATKSSPPGRPKEIAH
jgi:hypothetical protein